MSRTQWMLALVIYVCLFYRWSLTLSNSYSQLKAIRHTFLFSFSFPFERGRDLFIDIEWLPAHTGQTSPGCSVSHGQMVPVPLLLNKGIPCLWRVTWELIKSHPRPFVSIPPPSLCSVGLWAVVLFFSIFQSFWGFSVLKISEHLSPQVVRCTSRGSMAGSSIMWLQALWMGIPRGLRIA